MSDIQFVYFDLGGVLFNWKNAFRKLAVHIDRSYDDLLRIVKKYDDDMCRGKIQPNQLLEYIRQELDVDIVLEDFFPWMSENFTPILPMQHLLRQVAKKYHVGILTNIHNGSYEILVKKGFIPDIPYKTVIQSCELCLIKPEEKMFLHAQKKAGFPPSKILFIDDMQENLNTAKELGWNIALFEENHTQQSIRRIKKILGMN